MYRHWLWLLALVGLMALIAMTACSSDPVNEPPRVDLVYPDNGFHYTTSPDSMVANATDDRGVAKVDFYFDGNLLSTILTSPYSTRLPLGFYADGREYVIGARATDTDGARSGTSEATITIDPSLQTIPQIMTFDFDPDVTDQLRLTWLTFPDAVQRYDWEVARDDGFHDILLVGDTSDTSVVVAVVPEGLAYARVRASVNGLATSWSRISRFAQLETWRHRYPAPGPQLGTGIYQADDGTLRILSHGVAKHRISRAAVQLLALDAAYELQTVHDLLTDDYKPMAQALDADGHLRLAGIRDGSEGFTAAVDLDGTLLWSQTTDQMLSTTLLEAADGTWQTVGVDLRDGAAGGVFGAIGPGGEITLGATFALDDGWEIQQAWHRPDGGWVLAGQLPDRPEDGRPGGIWARGLDENHEVLWNLRLGTADRYLLRSGATDGDGSFLMTGMSFMANFLDRYGYVACFDQDGRIRGQVTDRNWHLFAGAVPDVGGRWTVVGVGKRSVGDNQWEYDFAMRGFSGAGARLWQAQHRAGVESQGWALARHPIGGWWAVGTRTENGSEYDVDLLRVDDRGAFD